jgi:hypothetical protein
MSITAKKPWALLLGLGLAASLSAGCTGPSGGGDDDDSTPPQNEGTVCHGDALAENVPLDDDLDGLRQRWDMNKELLRILFVGEPL